MRRAGVQLCDSFSDSRKCLNCHDKYDSFSQNGLIKIIFKMFAIFCESVNVNFVFHSRWKHKLFAVEIKYAAAEYFPHLEWLLVGF